MYSVMNPQCWSRLALIKSHEQISLFSQCCSDKLQFHLTLDSKFNSFHGTTVDTFSEYTVIKLQHKMHVMTFLHLKLEFLFLTTICLKYAEDTEMYKGLHLSKVWICHAFV